MKSYEEIKQEIKLFKEQSKQREEVENLTKSQVYAFEEKLRQAGEGQPCPRCNKIMAKDGHVFMPTVDHIVPETLLRMFGVDPRKMLMEENLIVICRRCNNFKSNQLDFANPATKKVLLELLEKM
jgi:5-methylcytosine-specific restriction endonuclease McrA